jgi:signal transduction histidine kinase/CheY-like chemotaxis protein
LPELKRAVSDLRAAAKLPIFKAHLALLEATVAWLEGEPASARKLLDRAEDFAREQTCPWVLFGVARVRAHMLRDDGKADAARDQARIADLLAREHGAEPRAALVREEFGLAAPVPLQAPSQVSTRKRRQLAALLRIVRSRGPMTPEEQAGAVLQDLLVELDAERGSLSFEPEAGGRGKMSVAKERAHDATSATEHTQELVLKTARDAGHTWPPDAEQAPSEAIQGVDPKRVLATPLFLYDAPVGAVSVERSPAAPPFSVEDRDLLDLLAHQVPIALEIGRLLVDREELQSSLRHAQKMEAVGQLAGGVAHDFNNMLAVIQTSLSLLGDGARLDERDASEIALIAQTTERSALLTRQLLSFSRHQPVPLARHDLNELLAEIRPLLERVLGPSITLSLVLGGDVRAVMTDASSLEQCIANLAVNARDAMPSGGRLRIETSRVTLDESAVLRGAPRAGSYACIAVTDTGKGLEPEIVDRVFEPFFTTKSIGGTRGLGLSNVYAFMKNSGGHVDVSSELGRGTTFRLYLAESTELTTASRPPGRRGLDPAARARMVLVVDDEPTVAKTTKRLLERDGFEVIVASGATQALDIVAERGDQISVAILDVMMPDMSGPELGRRFAAMHLPARLLYMSGYAPESIPEVDRDRFLQKPFSATELLSRVRRLIHG